MKDQINIMQTRQMLKIVNGVVRVLNQKERGELMLFCAKVLDRYEKEVYPNGLPMEAKANE